MEPNIPNVKLNNGLECPALGIGTYEVAPTEAIWAVKDAIDLGYRHIDCAFLYQNEEAVGAAIAGKIAQGVVVRQELFVTGKLWSTFHRPELVQPAIETTLRDLGLTYLDLYLIHWPITLKEGDALLPKEGDDPKALFADSDLVATWQAMEQLVEKKLARSIGVSNFNSQQVALIDDVAAIKPVTNQVECHPYLTQKRLKELCSSRDIAVTAYSPLGAPGRRMFRAGEPVLMDDPEIRRIAASHKKTPAQVALRYQIQNGNVVLSKSVRKERIKENMNIFDFELSEEEMTALDGLNRNHRYVPMDWMKEHPNYPFKIEF
ncbi:aldo-keto reductase family 1 member C4-like isoform X2 [Bacillus rossius redtenbacheri]|uniref:aldo-keto reductase family 1 member C4-like isoform X2 n=1 Tax=Bacillus rossius redtenbacheri TaxID=93214 RepID=UPI002FDD2D90